jgi:hypothetical protein
MMDEIHGPKGITDGEVWVATRKGWREWVKVLDGWKSENKDFSPTLRYLMKHCGLHYQWAQVIAVYYVRQRSPDGDLSHYDFLGTIP